MRIGSPLFIVASQDRCWKCRTIQRVIALRTSRIHDGDMNTMNDAGIGDSFLLRNVQTLPPPLMKWLAENEPHYRPHFSKKAGMKYFTNLCPGCGANFGDHYFHEPGGAFAPQTEAEAARIKIIRLPMEGVFEIEAAWVSGNYDLDLIQPFEAKRPTLVPRERSGLMTFLRQLVAKT